MEIRCLLVSTFAFFLVSLVLASHAAPSSEEYWNKLLPNTPMPITIQDSLHSGVIVGNKGVDVSVGKPGKGVDVSVAKPGKGVDVSVGKPGKGVDVAVGKPGKGVDVSVGKPGKGVDVTVGKPGKSVHVTVGKPGKGGKLGKGGPLLNVEGPKEKHVSVYVKPGRPFPFIYQYAATKTKLQDNPDVALFFVEKDLKPKTQMTLHFTKSTNDAPILPRPIANSIPFSSVKLPQIYSRFDIKPSSKEAATMKETVKDCETKAIKDEEKYCATSLESMLDYATSKLGKKLDLVTTSVEKETKSQKYVIKRVKMASSTATMVCHKMNYAYGVFYCHKSDTTKTYKVSLIGVDGTKVEAAVICHTNTSNWNPKHLAFQVLKVKPGTTPICHFLPEDHIVWISK